MKRLLAFLALCLPIYLFAQGFGSFSHDQPYFALTSAGQRTTTLYDGLYTYWALDVSNATRADSMGITNLYNGGVSPTNAVGVLSNAVGFNGNAGTIMGNQSNVFNTVSSNFSISFWFNPQSGANQTNRVLMARWYTTGDKVWNIRFAGTDWRLTARNAISQDFIQPWIGGSGPNSNGWNHVVFGWRNTDGVFWYSFNGSGKSTNNVGVVGSVSPLVSSTTAWLAVGNLLDGSFAFIGLMDEIGYWRRELTEQECADLYYNGIGWAWPFNPR